MLAGLLRRALLKRVFLLISLSFLSAPGFVVADELQQQFTEAQRLATQGQHAEAIAAYHVIIRSHPQLPEAYNNLAALYLKQKNTKQAKNILEQGLKAHKGYAALYENLTAINVALAREAYSKALQIDLKPSAISITSLSVNKDKNNSVVPDKVSKPIEAKAVADVVEEKQEATSNTEAIGDVLQAWSAAWSAQAVDVYLSFYHTQYKPTNGMTHKSWMQSRRYRLKNPSWIKVALSDFSIEKNTDKQAVVTFKQSYKSNSFQDVSSKQMVLLYTDDGWRIFREKNL